MSHTVTCTTEVKNKEAVRATCERLHLPLRAEGRHEIYSGRFPGLAVELPRWHYPIVINTETGEIKYDNFDGNWGDVTELDAFLQGYTLEAAKAAGVAAGYQVYEEAPQQDGAIKLVMNRYDEG